MQKVMTRNLWLTVLGVLLGTFLTAHAATYATVINGLFYAWPSSHDAKTLANNGSGTLTWTGTIDSGVPSGLIGFWVNSGSCPSGWSYYSAAYGRYIVQRSAGVTGTAGTAIDSNGGANWPAGTHGHTATLSASISDSAHSHTDSASNHDHDNIIAVAATTNLTNDGGAWQGGVSNGSSTGVSLQNQNANISASPNLSVTGVTGGATAGTNAPYIRVLVCQKS